MLRLILCQSIISRLPLTGSFNKLERRKIFSVEKTRPQTRLDEMGVAVLQVALRYAGLGLRIPSGVTTIRSHLRTSTTTTTEPLHCLHAEACGRAQGGLPGDSRRAPSERSRPHLRVPRRLRGPLHGKSWATVAGGMPLGHF